MMMHDDPETAPEAPNLREKVIAARERLAERTAGSRSVQSLKGVVEEHPVASVAAGLLVGALIASALPPLRRRMDKAASQTTSRTEGAVDGLRRSAAGLVSVAGKFALDYAAKAREAGREGLNKAESAGEALGEKVAEGSEEARRKAIDLAEIARAAAIEASEAALRKVTELAGRIKP
ncbi:MULTISPECIES: hypothetical protein [Novosphingobium]|uniref:hypothetical protein n=1 Tax=Novosphingobium TaxID=165696 RepID=UPI000D6E766D|nr:MULTISPECIES: hypothetical protein [Novosphingobium]